MLYLLLLLTLILWIIALFTANEYRESVSEQSTFIAGTFIGMLSIIALLSCWGTYSYRTETIGSQLEVLETQNEIILSQIEPLVQQALNYESNTYKEFKLTPENIVAFGNMYPQLQANSFIQSQINIIVENQKEIKDLKLGIASLNAYRLWLFTKKE